MAGTLVLVEVYLIFRLLAWATSWATVVAGIRRDGWARQYKAEGLPAGQTKIAIGEVHLVMRDALNHLLSPPRWTSVGRS